jgi:lipid II:glycine glycyltransferase (peptidoglycan interpeptide bridge formation enzyme)
MTYGYQHAKYANSLSMFGKPQELSDSQGWILIREISGSGEKDAMGCYPLFSCPRPEGLLEDVRSLDENLVSLTLVTDPIVDYPLDLLRECFPDRMIPFREHYVIDRHIPREESVKKNHRYHARKALSQLEIDVVENSESFLDEWTDLHSNLISRHKITGIQAFSKESFRQQFNTPGVIVIAARHEQKAVAAMIFCIQDGAVQAHVLGCTDQGYALSALYGIIWKTYDVFDDDVRWCNLMGVPGSGNENIRRFKAGWTDITKTAYLCGKIINETKYRQLAAPHQQNGSKYFPLYRNGEMM